MTNSGGSDWLEIAWEAAKWVLAVLGTAASSTVLWIARHYTGHLEMLKRHDEHINENDKAMGELVSFRKSAEKAPMGEAMVKVIDELKAEDRWLHVRISRSKKAQVETDKSIAELKTHIVWIRQHLENGGHEE